MLAVPVYRVTTSTSSNVKRNQYCIHACRTVSKQTEGQLANMNQQYEQTIMPVADEPSVYLALNAANVSLYSDTRLKNIHTLSSHNSSCCSQAYK